MQAQRGKHGGSGGVRVGREQQQIARRNVGCLLDGSVHLVAEELDDGAFANKLGVGVGVGDPGHALRAVSGSHVGKLLDVAAATSCPRPWR